MSRLDEMIREMCPDGVPTYQLREIFDMKNGYTPSKANPLFWENGTIPWFRMEDIRENGGILSDSLQHITVEAVKGTLFPANSIIVATSATIGVHALITVESLANQRFTYLTRKKDFVNRIEPRFAYYYCFKLDDWCLDNTNISSFASVDMDKFLRFKFPVPPLPVQREIVRILDNFTELTEKLTAELTARKKQYEFYRDKLLTFDNNVRIYHLKDICVSIADGDHMPPPKADSGVPFITISNITDNKQIDFTNAMYVPRKYFDELADKRKPRIGDILYTVVGSFGTPVHIDRQFEFVFQRHIAILRPNQELIMPRYMYHSMQSTDFYKQADKVAKGAAQRTISLGSLGDMTIPVPTLDVQKRLVNVLDNFDAICTDLNIGLPAEIEARKKQYEFYRDALLTYAATGKIIDQIRSDQIRSDQIRRA